MRAKTSLALRFLMVLWSVAFRSGADANPSFQLGLPPGAAPVIVKVGFYLKDINGVDEETQTFEFEGIVTLKWRDERQAFDPVRVRCRGEGLSGRLPVQRSLRRLVGSDGPGQ